MPTVCTTTSPTPNTTWATPPHAKENLDKARKYTKIPSVIADLDRLQRALDHPP